MHQDEAEGRLRQLSGIVEHYDINHWGREFLAAVAGSSAATKDSAAELLRRAAPSAVTELAQRRKQRVAGNEAH